MTSLDAVPPNNSIENRYYAYLRDEGYSTTQALHEVLAHYLPLFAGFPHVGDLGAGHGEFLALLRDQGHTVRGVDIDPAMVEHCRALGMDVVHADAVEWLAQSGKSFDGLFSSNVVEHLSAETVASWVEAAYMALRPGGVIVLTTPNPESLVVQFHEFWRDPTHVRMYSRQLLEFFLVDAGFERVSSAANPASAWEGIEVMLESVSSDLARGYVAEAPPLLSSPLPQQPDSSAPLRARLAWRMSNFVHSKFLEPWLLPLRRDIDADRARYDAILAAQRVAIENAQGRIDGLVERTKRLAAAERFAYPPREIFVVGYKPNPAGASEGQNH